MPPHPMPLNPTPLIYTALIESAPAWERYVAAGLPYAVAVAMVATAWLIWSIATHGRN